MPSRRKPGQPGNWEELDAATRAAELAEKLRANLARRKQQVRARGGADAATADPATLDRDEPAA